MRISTWVLPLLGLSALTGCAGASSSAKAPPGTDSEALVARVRMFESGEDELLRDLSAIDRRVASRARIMPHEDDLRRVAMDAVLNGDTTLAVVDGAIDPFSFDARARGLAAAKRKLGNVPTDLPGFSRTNTTTPAFERELLGRLVDEELVRLDEERGLPRSASALVRGIVETWMPPSSPLQVAERDKWLAHRLEELRERVGGLDRVRARELDDALDALEHAIAVPGFAGANGQLVELRQAIEGATPVDARLERPSDWSNVARRVQVHLGVAASPDEVAKRLDAAEKRLRVAAEQALASAGVENDATLASAQALVFQGKPCSDTVAGSRIRSMAAPPERIAACHIRHLLGKSTDERTRARALVVLHEHVVVAQWALTTARGAATLEQATARHRPMSLPLPDVTAHWERIALARPVDAIGGGLAAAVIAEGEDPVARAHAWTGLGEVPLDIAERELARPPSALANARASR